jgi:hypothetical protein
VNQTQLQKTTVEQLQRQYGTLKRAIIYYLENRMPEDQQAALERCVSADLINAVATNRANGQFVLHEEQA